MQESSKESAQETGEGKPILPGDEAAEGTAGTGQAICRECGGSGRDFERRPCPTCGGTGKVIAGVGGG